MPKTPKAQRAEGRSSPRCKKCDGRPLRSECEHTSKGRLYLEALASLVNAQAQPDPLMIPQPANNEAQPANNEAQPANNEAQSASNEAQPANNEVQGNQSYTLQPVDATAIDPALMALYTSTTGATEDVLQPVPQTPTRQTTMILLETPSVAPATPRRTRVSAENMLYGQVEGAKRGNIPYDIVRSRPLPPVITDSRLAGARFHRLISDLIVRSERISAATNCWLYIGAQHMNATSGLVSYASPRLRRDAKPELASIQNQFNKLVAALLTSRRRDAVGLALDLGVANKEKELAQREAKDARSVASSREETIRAQAKMIADLEAIVQGTQLK